MTILSLRRRTHVERKVLSLLRGADSLPPRSPRRRPDRSKAASAPAPSHSRYFSDLRHHAARRGLRVRPPETPYISEAELALLSWLAEAQRVAGPSSAPDDAPLVAALARCAGLLDGMGLHLSPLTLYGARLRDLAAPPSASASGR